MIISKFYDIPRIELIFFRTAWNIVSEESGWIDKKKLFECRTQVHIDLSWSFMATNQGKFLCLGSRIVALIISLPGHFISWNLIIKIYRQQFTFADKRCQCCAYPDRNGVHPQCERLK